MAVGFYLENERNGDITFHNGTEWTVLHPGTASQLLTMTSGRPAWAAAPAADAPTDAQYVTGAASGGLSAEIVVKVPPANGSIAYVVRKTANTVISSDDTLNDDPHLLLPMLASEIYVFQLHALIVQASGTPEFLYDFAVPASATGWKYNHGGTIETDLTTDVALAHTADTHRLSINGYVANSTNAGNLQWRWSQQVSTAADTTVLAGSHLIAWRVA